MILIALGSNLAGPGARTPREACERAGAWLGRLEGIEVVAMSGMYSSPPYPPSDQPSYVNAAVLLRGNVEPHDFLNRLHGIEARFGRQRSVANAARTLDLDLLAVDGIVIDTPRLRLPHPRLHLRRFVLMPLAEIVPGWTHPVLGRTVAALLAGLPEDGTCRLDAGGGALP